MKVLYMLKRLFAALGDFIIITLIVNLFSDEIVSQEAYDNLSDSLRELNEVSNIAQFDSSKILNNADDFALLYLLFTLSSLIYYVIIPLLFKGQTLMSKLFKVVVLTKDNALPSQSHLFARTAFRYMFVINLLLGVGFLISTDANFIIVLGFAGLLMLVFSVFILVNAIFLLMKGFSLVDLITKTRVYISPNKK